jgi:hypothetical protein
MLTWFVLEIAFAGGSVHVAVNHVPAGDFVVPVDFRGDIVCTIGEVDSTTDYSLSSIEIHGQDDILLCAACAEIHSDAVALKVAACSPDVVASLVGMKPVRSPTFASVLTKLCSVDILLSMFAQLDFVQQGETVPPGIRCFYSVQVFAVRRVSTTTICGQRWILDHKTSFGSS